MRTDTWATALETASIVTSIAVAIFGYYYLKFKERQRRLELFHQGRVLAMDKGIPLPEFPTDPPPAPSVSRSVGWRRPASAR